MAQATQGSRPGQATFVTGKEERSVIPRRSSVMRTPLEFRILARIANEMSSETVLVTGDPPAADSPTRRVSVRGAACAPSST